MKKFIKNKICFLLVICLIYSGFAMANTQTEVIIYSVDGREKIVSETEVELYEEIGWFREPVVLMYAIDGRTLIIKKSEVQDYEKVGWYSEPVIYMYSADERTLIVKHSEIDAHKKVGWFVTKEEAKYSVINQNELELLARIIHAEAADNNYLDRCYVGMVVINRKNSGIWGSSIQSVISAPGQYSSYRNKKFNSTIPTECYKIAQQIMLGETFGVPYNVIFQSGGSQGTGVWKVINNSSGYSNHYYCYGNI